MQDLDKFKNEMNLSGQNVYVGHRYVPKIMGDWDNTQIYEPLSIVQYQGNSFTSRQYVPSGIEITNEEYWASTGNYNAQVEQYRQEVRGFDDRISNNESGIENTNTQMKETTPQVYVETFKRLESETDDTGRIKRALAYAKENGIGEVILDSKIYVSNEGIEIPENIILLGTHNTEIQFTHSSGFLFAPHHKSGIKFLTGRAMNDSFNGSLLLLTNEFLRGVDLEDTSVIERCKFQELELFGNYLDTNPNISTNQTVGIHYLADSRLPDTGSGYWGTYIENVMVRHVHTVVHYETIGTGWVNGNYIRDIETINFKHFVRTSKSGDSQGIDMNEITGGNVQPTHHTREIFIDNSNNVYQGINVWDLHLPAYKNASMGVASHLIGVNARHRISKMLLSTAQYPNSFTLLGRFNNSFTGWDLTLSITGEKLGIDSKISIGSNGEVIRRNYGKNNLTNQMIKFYTRTLGDGSKEVYLQSVNTTTTRSLIIWWENSGGFTPTAVYNIAERPNNLEEVVKDTTELVGNLLPYEDIVEGQYHLLGVLPRTSSRLAIEIIGYYPRADAKIWVRGEGVVERKDNNVNSLLSNTNLTFYLKNLDDDSMEVYLKLATSLSVNIRMLYTGSFIPQGEFYRTADGTGMVLIENDTVIE